MNTTQTQKSEAEVVREYTPLDEGKIHGVTYDGKHVWFARDGELIAFDPDAERVVRRFAVPDAGAGTAFDGEHIYQLAKGEILVIRPDDGRVVRKIPSPGKGEDSGMAWADGYLWVGQYHKAKIHKVDAQTGEVVKTLASDRFVTGVSCIEGELWHGVFEEGVEKAKPCELLHLASDGTPLERMTVPVPRLAGMERTREGTFWCAGEKGKLRLVRRKAS